MAHQDWACFRNCFHCPQKFISILISQSFYAHLRTDCKKFVFVIGGQIIFCQYKISSAFKQASTGAHAPSQTSSDKTRTKIVVIFLKFKIGRCKLPNNAIYKIYDHRATVRVYNSRKVAATWMAVSSTGASFECCSNFINGESSFCKLLYPLV